MEHYLKKELYELIKKDENIFDFIQRSSLDGLWYWDLENTKIKWMNARFWEVLGYNFKEMPHTTSAWQEVINQEDLKPTLDNIQKHVTDPNYPYDHEVRFSHKNGSTVWIRCRGLVIRNTKGKPVRMLGAHQNITELKKRDIKYQSLAKETANNIRNLKAATHITTIFLDNKLKVAEFTPSDHTKKYTKNLKVQSINDIASHYNIENISADCQKVLQTLNAIEKEVVCTHGNIWWMRISPYKTLDRDIEGLIITFTDISEKKQLDRQVKLLSNILENTPDGCAIVNEQGKFIYVNRAYLDMWGYSSASEVLDISPESHSFNPNHPKEIIEHLQKEGKGEFQSVAVRKDNTTFEVGISASKYVDALGKVYFPFFFKDITQKKTQEKELNKHRNNLESLVAKKNAALIESEKRFRILFDDSPTGIYETDAEGKCLIVNKRWQEMAGMTNEEAQGDNWINGIYEEDRLQLFNNWNKFAKTGKSWSQEYRFCNKEGKITWVYGVAKPLLNENNQIKGYIGTNTDITEQKEAQTEVQKQRDMFKTVINSVATRIFWKDKNSVYLGCNPNFAADAGVESVNDVIGQRDEAFVWGKQAKQYRATDRKIIVSGKPKLQFEEPFIDINGKEIIWRTNKMPLKNSSGEIIGIIATAENITEEKKAANEIINSQKRYQSLFDNSPIPLWEEDFSEVKKFVDYLKNEKIKDFREYFKNNKDKVAACSKQIKIVDVNQAAVELHEAGSKEKLFEGLGNIFSEKSYEVFTEELITIAEGRSQCEFESTVNTINGKEIEVLLNWQVVPGFEETYEKIYISTSDITVLKQAERQTKASEEKYRLIAENSVDFIWQMDLRLNFTYASPAVFKLTGYTPDEWIGTNLANHCSRKELFKMARQAFGSVKNYKKNQSVIFESKILRKNGKEIPVEISGNLITNEKGLPMALQGSTRDITERLNAEKIIKQSEAKFRGVFEDSNVGIALGSDHGDIIEVNNEYLKITGYSREEFTNLNFAEITHPEDLAKELQLFDRLHKGEIDNYRIKKRLRTKNGQYRWLDCAISGRRDANGKIDLTTTLVVDIHEGKRANEIVNTFFEQPMNIHIIATIQGEILRINEGWMQTLGYSKEETINNNIFNFIHTDDKESTLNELKDLERGKKTYYFENRYKHKNGHYITLAWSAIYNTSGKLLHGIAKDITQQKAYHEQLVRSEERYKALSENAKHIILTHNIDGTITYANEFAIHYLGIPEKKIIGSDIKQFINNKYKKEHNKQIGKFKEEVDPNYRYHFELQLDIPSDKIQHLDVIASPILLGKEPDSILVTAYDITDRKLAEQKILQQNEEYEALNTEIQQTNDELSAAINRERTSNDRFNKAMEATSDGLFDWNLISNEIYYSPRWKAMLGYKEDELPNELSVLKKLTQPEDLKKSRDMLTKLKNREIDKINIKSKMKHKEGHWIDIQSRANVFFNNDGKANRIVGTQTDITARVKAEQELLLAKEKAEESNRLKSEFLHNMSHEIRTPMNGIMGFADLLCEPDTTNEQSKYYTAIIQNCSNQLLRIIDDILEISILETKQQKLNEESFLLNDFIMELFSIFDLKGKERNIPIYLKKGLSDKKSQIITDKAKLNKILCNLLENAFKFTSEGFIEFGYYTENSNLVLYVKDTGIGISKLNLERIFKRFSQESKDIAHSHGGLGLGLSIAKENAQLLGGDITVESDKGKGSAFYVSLPYKTNTVKDSEKYQQKNTLGSDLKKPAIHILVAEDEEINFLYIETILKINNEINCNVIHAKNGQEAVEMCSSNKEIKLVLMDIKMPVMNGYEATEKIRAEFPDLPVIAQTAYSTEADKNLALKHGCNDFISKPINKEKLFEMINRYLLS